jgi:hypothetical protein
MVLIVRQAIYFEIGYATCLPTWRYESMTAFYFCCLVEQRYSRCPDPPGGHWRPGGMYKSSANRENCGWNCGKDYANYAHLLYGIYRFSTPTSCQPGLPNQNWRAHLNHLHLLWEVRDFIVKSHQLPLLMILLSFPGKHFDCPFKRKVARTGPVISHHKGYWLLFDSP